jgi:hypothetical protein
MNLPLPTSFPATSPLLSLVCRQGRCVLLIVILLPRNTQRPHLLCTNLQQQLLEDVAGKKRGFTLYSIHHFSFPATSPLLSLVCRQGRCVLLIVTLLLRNTQRPHQLFTKLQQHLLGDVTGKKRESLLGR